MYEDIADILKRIKNTIHPETIIKWEGIRSDKELLKLIERLIIRTQKHDKKVLAELDLLFAPTGNFKTLADTNGWTDEFTVYSRKFDAAFDKIRSRN